MRFLCSTALLLAAILIAIGPLGGCTRLPETSLGASTGSLATGAPSRGLYGELPGQGAKPPRVELSQREAWGETRVTRLPSGPDAGGGGSILVARGNAAAVQPGRPSQAMIASELAARFPDLAMKVVTDPLYNAYGPFGLAVGADPAGGTCGYAWQWIEDQPRLALARGDAASVRIAVCLPGRTPVDLAALVKQLALKDDKGPAAPGRPLSARPAAARAAPTPTAPPVAAAPVAGEGKLYLAPAGDTAPPRPGPSASRVAAPAGAVIAGPIVPLPQAD